MFEKEVISAIAIVIGLASHAIYAAGVWQRKIKPHAFSWLVWGVLMSIGCAAQLHENAGPGTWVLGMNAAINFSFAICGFLIGEKNITRGDKFALLFALSTIPVWKMMEDPVWAVVMVSIIDVVAMYPTFRKSWYKPWEDGALAFSIATFHFILSLFALDVLNVTTVLYPVTIVSVNTLFVLMLLYRRRVLA